METSCVRADASMQREVWVGDWEVEGILEKPLRVDWLRKSVWAWRSESDLG